MESAFGALWGKSILPPAPASADTAWATIARGSGWRGQWHGVAVVDAGSYRPKQPLTKQPLGQPQRTKQSLMWQWLMVAVAAVGNVCPSNQPHCRCSSNGPDNHCMWQ
jgi:hypothetical protein